MNGDQVHDIFSVSFGFDVGVMILSRLYHYSFCLLFISTVLHIFLLIMEDAFFSLVIENQMVPLIKKKSESLEITSGNLKFIFLFI